MTFLFLTPIIRGPLFDIVYAVDNDEYCTKIYNANFEHKCLIKDVREIDPTKIPDFDVLVGGFPCQSFFYLRSKSTPLRL